jgi:hypothetical protein
VLVEAVAAVRLQDLVEQLVEVAAPEDLFLLSKLQQQLHFLFQRHIFGIRVLR